METNKLQNIERFQGERRGGLIRSEKWNDNFNKIVDNLNQNANTINENFESISAETIPAVINEEDSNLQIVVDTMLDYIDDRYTKEEIDTRVATLTSNLVKDVSVDTTTGVITIVKSDDTSVTFDTMLEKIPVKVEFVEESGVPYLLVTNDDGTSSKTDLSKLIDVYDVQDSDTIAMSKVDGSGGTINPVIFSADVKENSIELRHLNVDAISTIEGYANSASLSATNAGESERLAKDYSDNAEAVYSLIQGEAQNAADYADDSEEYSLQSKGYADESKAYRDTALTYNTQSKSYAVGGTSTRPNEDVDNAKYYSQQAKEYAKQAQESAGGDFVTKTEFSTSLGTKADLIDGKVDPNQLPEGGGSFEIKITIDADENVTVDKTFEEIHTAITDGKYVYATSEYFSDVYLVTECADGNITLSNTYVDITDFDVENVATTFSYIMIMADNSVYLDYLYGEVPQSLVYEIGESSSHTEVPTALAVKTAIEEASGGGEFVVTTTLPTTPKIGESVNITLSATLAEIQQAIADGKVVYCLDNASDRRLGLELCGNYSAYFALLDTHFSEERIDNILQKSLITHLIFVRSTSATYMQTDGYMTGGVRQTLDSQAQLAVPNCKAVKTAIDTAVGKTIGFDNAVTTILADSLKADSYTIEIDEEGGKPTIVQGSVTYNSESNGAKNIDVGFKPDLVIIEWSEKQDSSSYKGGGIAHITDSGSNRLAMTGDSTFDVAPNANDVLTDNGFNFYIRANGFTSKIGYVAIKF